MVYAATQVTHFEFSNESNKAAYNGMATAAQYTAALLDWGPRLKAIKPDLLLGANGVAHCGLQSARSGHSEAPGDSNVCWWQHVRPTRATAKGHCVKTPLSASRAAGMLTPAVSSYRCWW